MNDVRGKLIYTIFIEFATYHVLKRSLLDGNSLALVQWVTCG